MNNKLKYILGITILFGILVYLKTIAPRETNWTPTYSANDKVPFGTWVLRNSLEDLFPKSYIKNINKSFYEDQNKDSSTCNLFIITNLFNPDSLDLDVLFRKAANGSNILIASEIISNKLTDSLKVSVKRMGTNVLDSTTVLQNWNGAEWGEKYHFRRLIQTSWLELSDATKAIVLGKGNNRINYIKVHYGRGNFFLHTQPLAFTNYHLLYNDHHYLEEVLGWFPKNIKQITWNEYYKPFHIKSQSPIKIILSVKPLRAAYWTLIIGLALYILINIRRRQRPIPIFPPKENLTMDFVQTIGLLYFNQKNHKDLIKKIFAIFSEYISSNYFIRIEFSSAFYQKLALKSGVSEKIVNRIFTHYETLSIKEQVYESELIQFNRLIEIFYAESSKPVTSKLTNKKQNKYERKSII